MGRDFGSWELEFLDVIFILMEFKYKLFYFPQLDVFDGERFES